MKVVKCLRNAIPRPTAIAKAASASLTAMAPGVAGALIATVVGLFVAIPAMFAYNYMITTIRSITQQLDGFAKRNNCGNIFAAIQKQHTQVHVRGGHFRIERRCAFVLGTCFLRFL